MSETNQALFYNSVDGDRIYDADDMTTWLKPFFVTGVFYNELQVTANDDMTVTVAAGYTNIGGKVKNFPTEQTFTLELASGTLDRIDTVIIRRDDTDRDIYIEVVTGAYASNPSATDPVRTGAYYDLVLAQIYVAAGTVAITQAEITDTRASSSLCGWVVATVTEIDFDQITAQFESYFANYQAKVLKQYKNYVSVISDYGDKSAAAYDSWSDDLDEYRESCETEIKELVEEMKTLLDGATAAKLQLEIDSLSAKIGNAITDLSTKLKFTDHSSSDAEKKITVTNTTTGTVTTITYAAGGVSYFTEPGEYKVEMETENYLVTPGSFTLDYTKTTETLNFDIYAVSDDGYVGGYVGAYVTANN